MADVLNSNTWKHLTVCKQMLNSIVSLRWMIHSEERVLDIFIQHQYNKLQTINKRTYKT